jgi:hypothetical protein
LMLMSAALAVTFRLYTLALYTVCIDKTCASLEASCRWTAAFRLLMRLPLNAQVVSFLCFYFILFAEKCDNDDDDDDDDSASFKVCV